MCSVVFPIKEVSLFSGGFIHFSTRDNVQIRKVSVFWSSLIEKFHCIILSSSKWVLFMRIMRVKHQWHEFPLHNFLIWQIHSISSCTQRYCFTVCPSSILSSSDLVSQSWARPSMWDSSPAASPTGQTLGRASSAAAALHNCGYQI